MFTAVTGTYDGAEVSILREALSSIMLFWSTLGYNDMSKA
jgi:hypothetical protein